jgi:methionyl-tRNA formyltransferase
MKANELKIVFLGTPDFAVATLSAIHRAGYNIVGVITAPDKPSGRGLQLQQSAVKQYAVTHQLKVLQPEKLKNPVFLEELQALQADIQVVVAFRMLPEKVWDMPPRGTYNVHASLLPKYRGAAPINWAVINGETETGVTTFKLQHQIDTGDIALQKKMNILPEQNVGQIHDALMQLGAEAMLATLALVCQNVLQTTPQVFEESLPHAPKIFTETCLLDFNKSCTNCHNLVRGLSPYPTAFTFVNNKKLKVFESSFEQTASNHSNQIKTDHKSYLSFGCNDGWLNVLDVQLEGKKRMPISALLNGFKINI